MEISSPAFKQGGIIPSLYTCEGKNTPPPLEFKHIPKEAKSLVLIMDDPDVPSWVRLDCMYDHWVVYDIPPDQKTGTHGKNTAGKNQYTGPCPPNGEHRYFFKLYALDKTLGLPPGATKKEVEKAMEGHILAKAELMGRYEKGKGT
jgi:Raf kinase inhibitor-like YbhB/YbcL family protein